MDKRMKKASRAHQAGDLAAACLLYRKVAKDAPHDLDAWYLLGTAEAERGRYAAAAEAFARAEGLAPRSALVQNNLGNVRFLTGDLAGARDCYRKSVDFDPRLAQARYNLGRTALQLGDPVEAEAQLGAAVALDAGFLLARNLLGALLLGQEREAEARVHFEAAARAEGTPQALEARHFLDALEGQNPARPPSAYVRGVFDGYAGRFDQHLQGELGYSAPERAAALLAELRLGSLGRVADLGCGTGLSGAAVAERATELLGVDLSPGMLEEARKKGCYTSLEEADLEAWLDRAAPAGFDLLLALDVLIYLGDPGPLLQRAARSLAPGGLLVLTLETGERATPFQLRPTGRYAHDPEALAEAAAPWGLRRIAGQTFPLRRERDVWIEGWLGAFEREP
jgi:predicted TPR repeat methyltransferase